MPKLVTSGAAWTTNNPEAAIEPFVDFEFEPPLVCAVRLQCKVAIVRLLLKHGADPAVTDIYGRTPMQSNRGAEDSGCFMTQATGLRKRKGAV